MIRGPSGPLFILFHVERSPLSDHPGPRRVKTALKHKGLCFIAKWFGASLRRRECPITRRYTTSRSRPPPPTTLAGSPLGLLPRDGTEKNCRRRRLRSSPAGPPARSGRQAASGPRLAGGGRSRPPWRALRGIIRKIRQDSGSLA